MTVVRSEGFDAVVAPEFLDGLTTMSLVDVHMRRDQANEVETSFSYLRRLVQGRLDIVLADRRRRDRGQEAGGVSALVEQLPEILGEHVHAPGWGRLPTLIAPGEVDEGIAARLDAIVPPSQLASLPGLTDADLDAAAASLVELERRVSSQRHALHQVLDRLQAEVVRRYKTGEANVDSLLSRPGL